MKALFKDLYAGAVNFKEKVVYIIKSISRRDDDFNNPYLIF
ncbi:MAG TPA: hypothetical protein PLA68_07785 [Panacibacter sp.]|nr:hypothetical protein [Panacibacter sp.]